MAMDESEVNVRLRAVVERQRVLEERIRALEEQLGKGSQDLYMVRIGSPS